MEKVVYILGAGFSAPAGLPVMSNFLVKSKDMFASDPEKYRHFEAVFKTISKMHVCKSYFDADLWNIEEILSILEMREGIDTPLGVRSFVNYIADVIKFYTPSHKPPNRMLAHAGAWTNYIFEANDGHWALPRYAAFASNLLNLNFTIGYPNSSGTNVIKFKPIEQPSATYSVISLNYDLVLENVCSFLNENHPSEKLVSFRRGFDPAKADDSISIPLAKLHGSVDSQDIISPTWNKSFRAGLVSDWKIAHELIANANHIRIVGYSLPTSDAYIKYLLKSAVVEAKNLKTIDIICMGKGVRERYEAFVQFNFSRFKDADIAHYLHEIYRQSSADGNFDQIESAHADFME